MLVARMFHRFQLAQRHSLLLTLILGLTACRHAQPAPVAAQTQSPFDPQPLHHVLDDWHAAAAQADETRYFSHFADSAVFLGTDAEERWTLPAFRAFAHPFFARGKAWSFRTTRRAIQFAPAGNLAWFDEELATPNMGPARGSGVLTQAQNGRWLIVHYNLTLTIPNAQLKQVKALLSSGAPCPTPQE